MRRCWLIAILLLVVGCSKDVDFEPSQEQAQNRILSGIIADEKDEDNESRVYLDNKIRIRWNKGDLISVFDGTTRNKEFAFLGSDGSSAGDFEDNSAGTIGTGNAIDRLYGLYPYASSTEYCYGEDESEADYLRYTLPATQTYKPNSIGLNANLMVAATANKSDKTLVFRNVCSYLRLKLYGADQTVSSIVFKGNTDEVLTGDVAITASYGNAPTIKMLGVADEDNKTITLDCSEGVDIGNTSDEATEFWLVVPPVNFPNGFTIKVKGEGNMGQEIVVNNNLTFARNTYNTITREVAMTEVSDPSTEIPNNQIWYTATEKVTPYKTDVFGAAIVANEWDSATGNGVITFSHAIKSIGERAFEDCTSLTSITLPEGVTQIGHSAFENCTSLIEVYCKPTTPPAGGTNMFFNNAPGRKIYVPAGSGEAYKTAEYWSDYASIIEEMGSETPPDNEIWYTATAKVVPNKVDTYYWPSYYYIESNEWDETTGNGVIRFRDKVTSIGGHAFSDHSAIKNIILPNTITYIGDYAFEDCSNLKSITIPENVTNIGIRAFKDCIRLEQFKGKFASADGNSLIVNGVLNSFAPVGVTEYTIPESVTEIGVWVFNSYSNLTKITIPNSVTKIGDGAFAYCSGLSSLTIPNSVTEIGNEAFWSCTKLDGIYINNPTPPTAGENMLSYNMEKVKIYVPADYIDAYLASSCWQNYADHLVAYDFEKGEVVPISFNTISYTATEKVTPYKTDVFGAAIVSNEWDSATGKGVIKFDRNVTSFGDYAFYNCRNLTGITIPNSVAEIGVRAFGDCRNLESITIGNFVTKIGDSAFFYCTNLKSITIPDSIEEIGAGAFRECSKLESITIPNSVAKIGERTFEYCSSLENVTIGNSVTKIGDYAFKDCESLESITVPNSVAEIGNYAFDGCSSLKSTTIGTGITTIGEWAFLGCTGELFVNGNIPKNAFYQSDFTKVTIGNGVTTIGEGAFIICHSLMSIVIPNSVTEIGKEAFYYCDKLASISIPNSVTKIGESAFIYCSGLENVTIGSGVTKIGVAVFKECTGLASITIPNNVTEVGNYAFYGCTGLTSIIIPNSVTTIGSSAFGSCSNLENVTIGNIVTKVGDYAFEDCGSLTEITIPNSVTSIGYAAFRGCSNLKSAYCRPATPPTIGSFAFDSNASDRKIYVPKESFYTYRSKWSSYSSAIESYKFD